MRGIKLLGAALALLVATSTANSADVVKFGSLRVPVQIFAGIEKGFFAEQDISVETTFFKSGAEIAPAVAIGQIDVAMTTSGAALFNAMARGIEMKIVAEGLSLEPSAPGGDPSGIVIRKALEDESGATMPEGLKGRTLASTAPGQILDQILRTYLENGGVSATDVTFVSMPLPDMIPALTNGAIDGAILVEPFMSMATGSNLGVVVATASEVMPNATQAFVIYSNRLVDDRDLGIRFLKAYLKTNSWLREVLPTEDGRSEVAAIYQKYVPAKNEDMYRKIALGTASADAAIKVEGEFGIRWQLENLRTQGLINGEPDLDAYIDTSMLDEARK